MNDTLTCPEESAETTQHSPAKEKRGYTINISSYRRLLLHKYRKHYNTDQAKYNHRISQTATYKNIDIPKHVDISIIKKIRTLSCADLAPLVGLEPTTCGLTVRRSTD